LILPDGCSAATAGLVLYLVALILGAGLFDRFMGEGLVVSAAIVMAAVFPLGLLLGVYFPFGLELVGGRYEQTIPWAWGINSGFGSRDLSIITQDTLTQSWLKSTSSRLYCCECCARPACMESVDVRAGSPPHLADDVPGRLNNGHDAISNDRRLSSGRSPDIDRAHRRGPARPLCSSSSPWRSGCAGAHCRPGHARRALVSVVDYLLLRSWRTTTCS
jgi:hypothetical protein